MARQRTVRATACRDFDLVITGDAVQLTLVAFFQAFLADVFGASVVGSVLAFFEPLGLFLVDAAYVANHVGCGLAQRVLAEQTSLDINAGEAIALRGKARDFFISEAGANRQALEGLGFFEQATEALAVARLDVDQLRELVDHGVDRARDFRRRDFQRVRGEVAREDHAITVNDQATIGHRRHHRDAVAFGALEILAVAHGLQPEEAQHEQAEADEDHEAGHGQAQPEQL